LPSGEKLTQRSCSGVFVICFVDVPSTLVVNTSPRKMNATSLPLGDTAISRAWPVTGVTRSLLLFASAIGIATFTFCGWPLAVFV
jgi:hypothetical protein